MARVYYPVAGATILILISTIMALAPATVQDITRGQINTTQLQTSTDVQNSSFGANATVQTTGLVEQTGDLVGVLTNPQSGNRLIGALFTLITIGLIAWIILALIPG